MMEMRHIRTFLTVAEELHFGRAAARLRVAQPAVSMSIRQLEEEVGAVLFDRTRRRVALSAAGHHLRPALLEALSALESGVRGAQRAARGETGRVVIYFTAMAAFTLLPPVLAHFRRRRPDVQVLVRQMGTQEQIEAVRAGRCDLAFTIMPGPVEPLASARVGAEALVAVVPTSHRLARARAVRFSDLAAEPMLILPRSSEPAISAAYERMCRAAGVTPNVAMELAEIETTLAFVAAALGISLMPASVRRVVPPGVALVPLSPRVRSEATLVWDPGRLSAAGRELLAALRAADVRGDAGSRAVTRSKRVKGRPSH